MRTLYGLGEKYIHSVSIAASPAEVALEFWFEIRKGIDESLRDFL